MRSALSFDDWRSQGHLSHIIQTLYEHGSETSRPFRKLRQTYQPTDNLSTNHGPTNRQSLTIIRFIYAEWQWFFDIGKTTCFRTKPRMQIYKSLFQTSMERKRIYLKTFKAQIRFSINICNVRSSKQSSFIQTMFIHPNNVQSSKHCSFIQTMILPDLAQADGTTNPAEY